MNRVPATFDDLPSDAPSRLTLEEVFSSYQTSSRGLSEEEARRRLERFGRNDLETKRVSRWRVLTRQFRSPMVYLLAAAAAISLALGGRVDGITILAMLCINAGIGYWQEARSERAVEKLRERLAPRARVRRGGHVMVVDRRAVVPGDVVILTPGDIVPADLRITLSRRLTVDESALTGESVAVAKVAETDAVNGKGRARDMAYLMTRVAFGSGEGVAVATGALTAIGRIARLTDETERVSAFQRNIESFSGFLLKAVLAVLAVVFVVNVGLKGESQIMPQFLFAAALAVSVIPEALPAITSVTLSAGALRLSRRHVVVKRLSAIEDLGHIEVFCTDKTGTLTEGVMRVDGVSAPDRARALSIALGVAEEEELEKPSASPKTFDAALVAEAGHEEAQRARRRKRHWFTPFDPSRRRASAVFDDERGPLLAVFGAPEEILARSTARMTASGEAAWSPQDVALEREAIRKEGLQGRRVLALAVKRVPALSAYGDEDERDLTYVGRIAFIDPLKPTAKAALEDARKLDVRVKILTGDSPEVAAAVGLEVGILERAEDVVTGETLDAATEEEFHRLVTERDVFARVLPEQKHRIILTLEKDFQVGFLGEGINDAPALKAANVAMAVDHASDVAREAADIVLMRKDLRVIVDGIRQGRAIFTNVVKYVKYTLVGNFGNFLAIAGVSLLIEDLPMLPVQILLVNLLTDLPLITVAGDSVDEAEVARPKRFNLRELAFIGVFLGLVSSFFDFAYFALNRGEGMPAVRTLWFQFSVVTELALIYSIRTRGPFWKASRPTGALVALSLLTVGFALLLPLTSFGQEIFHLIRPSLDQLKGVFLLALAYFAVTETVKLSYVRVFRTDGNPIS